MIIFTHYHLRLKLMQRPILSYAIHDNDVVQCSFIKTSVLRYYYMPLILFDLKKVVPKTTFLF